MGGWGCGGYGSVGRCTDTHTCMHTHMHMHVKHANHAKHGYLHVSGHLQFLYRSGTVNSKSFVGKVLLRIKRKFELNYAL